MRPEGPCHVVFVVTADDGKEGLWVGPAFTKEEEARSFCESYGPSATYGAVHVDPALHDRLVPVSVRS